MKLRNLFYGLLAVMLVLMLFGMLVGCAPGDVGDLGNGVPGEADEAAGEKVLRIRFGADISGLDPLNMFGYENETVAANIYNALTKYSDETGEIISDLAHQWEISDDGLTYTFYIHEGVQWHHGYGELTAEDVKFSFERIMDPNNASRYQGELAVVDSIEVVDPYTIKFRLNQIDMNFLHKVTGMNYAYIVNEQAIEDRGEEFNFDPVGTGPFVFDDWLTGTQVVLRANDEYFEGRPAIDEVVFKIIGEEASAEIALMTGEIDVFFGLTSGDIIKRLEAEENIEIITALGNSTNNLVLNSTYEPLSDKRVRQAIKYAINRAEMIEHFFLGLVKLPDSILPPHFQEFTDDLRKYPYDPEKAKELLKDAGYEDGFTLDLVTVKLYPFDQVVVLFASDLEKVGITANIVVLERAAYGQARSEGNIQTCITNILGGRNPDNVLGRLLFSAAFPPGMNTARYTGIDELFIAARSELDQEKRIELYRDIQKQIAEDVPVIPLWGDILYTAVSDRVINASINGQRTLFLHGFDMIMD